MNRMSAIVLAGGLGKRLGRPLPKQLLLLRGKPMLIHTLERLDLLDEIDRIVMPCPESYLEEIVQTAKNFGIRKEILCIEGGQTRQESVHNALREISTEYVLLHESARPFVTVDEFRAIVRSRYENVTYATPLYFTVLEGNEVITGVLKRETLLNIQLPQKFRTDDLRKCHELARQMNDKFTEDAGMIVKYLGKPVNVLRGSEINKKITTPLDVKISEILYDEMLARKRGGVK